MRKKLKLVGKILSATITVLLAIVLVCNVYVMIARKVTGNPQPDVFGWSWAIVASGSMSPKIEVDDLVIVHKQKDYDVRDVITFKSGRGVVTHRIIEDGGTEYTTKGDANNTSDKAPVKKENVVGRVVMVVPNVGAAIRAFRTPLGLTAIIFIGLMLIELPYIIDKLKKSETE